MLIPGSEYSVETSVVILWAWLLLPLFLVAFTFVFLVATIWTNHHRRVKTWRSSSLAVLSGLSPEAREQFGGLITRRDLKITARKLRVRLVEEGGVWKLVAE
jgi:hypothetical protein